MNSLSDADVMRISRFPIISGFRISWDSRRPPGQRVLGIWLVQEPSASSTTTPVQSGTVTPSGIGLFPGFGPGGESTPQLVDIEEVQREKEGRKYRIVTREYMAQGHDGFEALKGHKYLVDDETGQMMSTIVRKYLLGKFPRLLVFQNGLLMAPGCQYVAKLSRITRLTAFAQLSFLLQTETEHVIKREKARIEKYQKIATLKGAPSKWRHAAHLALRWSRSHYRDHIYVTEREHMSSVDCFDGAHARCAPQEKGDGDGEKGEEGAQDLITIHPVVDGRLHDEGRN